MVGLAATIWRPQSGNGEAGQSDNALLATQSGLVITTQSGRALQIQPGTYTPLPATEWAESEGE